MQRISLRCIPANGVQVLLRAQPSATSVCEGTVMRVGRIEFTSRDTTSTLSVQRKLLAMLLS
jgi:hypothetical protein